MDKLFKTQIGRLRLLGFLEGISLLLLLLIGIPLKYYYLQPGFNAVMGPVHGAIFLLFVINLLSAGVTYKWSFRRTTLKIMIACFVPFGTFYIDATFLSKIQNPI